MKNKILKDIPIIVSCLYHMICIAGLYVGLPFWRFYRYLCKIGEKRYQEYFN